MKFATTESKKTMNNKDNRISASLDTSDYLASKKYEIKKIRQSDMSKASRMSKSNRQSANFNVGNNIVLRRQLENEEENKKPDLSSENGSGVADIEGR